MGERVEKIKDGVILPQNIKPKIIVGADGVYSIVSDYIGIRKPRCGVGVEAYSSEIDYDMNKCHVVREFYSKHLAMIFMKCMEAKKVLKERYGKRIYIQNMAPYPLRCL